ncbi:MAG: hypothetical protein WCT50_04480 [Patescibacteria group bacterium]
MGQIILGVAMTAAGAFLVIKTEWFINNFGRIAWFEAKLGSDGGSRLGYKLVGIIILVLGIIVMTGSGDNFMYWLLGPLLKYNQPQI